MPFPATRLILDHIKFNGFCDVHSAFDASCGHEAVERSIRLLTHDDDIVNMGNGRFALHGFRLEELLSPVSAIEPPPIPMQQKDIIFLKKSVPPIVPFDLNVASDALSEPTNNRWGMAL